MSTAWSGDGPPFWDYARLAAYVIADRPGQKLLNDPYTKNPLVRLYTYRVPALAMGNCYPQRIFLLPGQCLTSCNTYKIW